MCISHACVKSLLQQLVTFSIRERPFDINGGGGGRRLPAKQTFFQHSRETNFFFPKLPYYAHFFFINSGQKQTYFSTQYRKQTLLANSSAPPHKQTGRSLRLTYRVQYFCKVYCSDDNLLWQCKTQGVLTLFYGFVYST